MSDSIPVFYCVDKNNYELVLVSMTSIMENTDRTIDFYILHCNLNQGILLVLSTIKKYDNCNIFFKNTLDLYHDEHKSFFENKPVDCSKVFIPDISKHDKAICLDSTTLIRSDIFELYSIELEDKSLAAIKDIYIVKSRNQEHNIDNYFNTAVLLLNCKKMRNENIKKSIYDFMVNGSNFQDAANIVLNNDTKLISQTYNLINTWWLNDYNEYKGAELDEYIKSSKNPKIVHFTGPKPTNPRATGNPHFEDWWKYAKYTTLYRKMLERYKKESDIILYRINLEYYKWKYPNFFKK